MAVLSGLKPERVFAYFEKLCSVPHGSGNTKIISDMCVGFAKEMGLRYRQGALQQRHYLEGRFRRVRERRAHHFAGPYRHGLCQDRRLHQGHDHRGS